MLFDPSSIAIVGASDDESKWGNWLAKGALRGEHRRRVALVNRRGGTVLGRQTHVSTSAVPGGVDLAVICVPAEDFEAAISDAFAVGARAIVGISAGLGETGEDGRRREAAAASAVREAGAVLLGPNCLGILDSRNEIYLTSNDLPAGSVGLRAHSRHAPSASTTWRARHRFAPRSTRVARAVPYQRRSLAVLKSRRAVFMVSGTHISPAWWPCSSLQKDRSTSGVGAAQAKVKKYWKGLTTTSKTLL